MLPGRKEAPPAPLCVRAPCSLFSCTVFTPLLVSGFVLSTPQSFFPTSKKSMALFLIPGCAGSSVLPGLSLWRAGATLRLQCTGFSFWSTGSAVVGRVLSCSAARAVFPDQGWSLCILAWQVDSLSLSHQGSPDLLNLENRHWTIEGIIVADRGSQC